MGNVNMPTPVAVAGGALCLLAGYLVGAVAGPDTKSRTTAEVESYDNGSKQLCLRGDGIEDQPGVEGSHLCGEWRRPTGDAVPHEGDSFRFVSIVASSGDNSVTYIYGSVVEK
jgi:hypothetical protein